MDLERARRTGIKAAYRGGAHIRDLMGRARVEKKGAIDLVTEADLAAERAVIDTLRNAWPDHAILSEEGGETAAGGKNSGGWQWIIDPLDGTTNFAHGLPICCVSIGLVQDGAPRVGVVFNPLSGELFTAVAGAGAERNGAPIRASNRRPLSECLLVTGFPYDFKEIFEDVMTRFGNCLKASRGVRRLGSAAIDLCWVACGRFDGFWEQNLNPWDTAAGWLIATEAGAVVTDFSNNPYTLDKKEILAANGAIHQRMLELLRISPSTSKEKI